MTDPTGNALRANDQIVDENPLVVNDNGIMQPWSEYTPQMTADGYRMVTELGYKMSDVLTADGRVWRKVNNASI